MSLSRSVVKMAIIKYCFHHFVYLFHRLYDWIKTMDRDNIQAEISLLSDMEVENERNAGGVHQHHNSDYNLSVVKKCGHTAKSFCFMVATTLVFFITGLLVGYTAHRRKETSPVCSASVLPFERAVAPETGAAPLMDWDKVKSLLNQRLTAAKIETAFSEFSKPSHRAGSPEDDYLGNKVLQRFKDYGMNTWNDEHFVKVQDPPASGSNRIIYKNDPEERPKGFLSYSGNGSVKGAALYACYGQESDFRLLRDKNINMNGRVMLVRAGKISFAEKVANAAKVNASAVLIYPDPADYSIGETTDLYGHVHLGSGDPYTPGFPSINHTQFPPVEPSGLPNIPAQTITSAMATKILWKLGGQSLPEGWEGFHKLGNENDTISVEVNNFLTEKKINNVFGVVKGLVDADRYVVIGAQRDAWGPGFAASTVGTSVLVELARSVSDMVEHDGFKPRRSIVFASWSAGEYGSVGATEWLEGYLSSLGMKAFSYINLDGIVTGTHLAASPLMHTLIEKALNEFILWGFILFCYSLEPMQMDNTAYPFLAFSGIPSMSFRFTSGRSSYQYLGTLLDTQEKLNAATSSQVPQLAAAAGRFAGSIALRLVHDHLLQMNLRKYDKVIRFNVAKINAKIKAVQKVSRALSTAASFSRASRILETNIQNSNLDDIKMCRIINDQIMMVERNFLSPYVSVREIPFRHILLGVGSHTLKALPNHLDALKADNSKATADLFWSQLALATLTIQSSANSLAGDIWSLDNEI
uniref:Transferrin receptor protein 1 n=1 Tax=Nothobranchius furzeri TaxID=105023 RepID=A0A8C6LGJ5_NOTFU